MSTNEVVYIIDDNEERRNKLSTIIDFLGKSCTCSDYHNPQSPILSQAHIVIVGAHPSTEETIDLLHELAILAPKVPIILVSPPVISVPASIHNVLANLCFPFS